MGEAGVNMTIEIFLRETEKTGYNQIPIFS